jgi:HrpA-like RNA helicase
VKQKVHNPETGMETLMVIPISKVQAMQRTGRAGRTMEGKCYRLYTVKHFEHKMLDTTVPEILRTNLASTVLTLLNLGIRNVMKFDFIESPDRENLLFALKQLFLLKAVDGDAKLTDLGREMNKFPLEPAYSKILLASKFYNCSEDIVILVSLLSTENIWIPISSGDEYRFQKSEDVRKSFMDPTSDHLTLVNVYQQWRANHYSDAWLRKNFLLFRAMKQARKIREQLFDILDRVNFERTKDFFKSAIGLKDDGQKQKKFRR